MLKSGKFGAVAPPWETKGGRPMKSRKRAFTLRSILNVLAVALMLVPGAWSAPKYRVLYAFVNKSQGWAPYAGVVFDSQGNLFGTSAAGGAYGWGTVYELTPNSHGKWSEAVLYSFCPGGWPCNDGANPNGGVIVDQASNLYGTTVEGGTGAYGSGTIFELSPGSGGWTHTVLYNFCSLSGCEDGASPMSGLVTDGAGNLYGTAGDAIELSPGSDGWTETVIHTFCSTCKGGSNPYAGMILDRSGDLYGTTMYGGDTNCLHYGCGTAFELILGSGGRWKEHVLHNFGSILNFTEYVFGLGEIDPYGYHYADYWAPDGPHVCTTCQYTYSLADFFNFSQSPTTFTTIPLPSVLKNYNAEWFEDFGTHQGDPPPSDPDDDAVEDQ